MVSKLLNHFQSAAALEVALRNAAPEDIGAHFDRVISEADSFPIADEYRERLVRVAWSKADPSSINYDDVVVAARAATNPTVRNAVATLLSPDMRRLLYSVAGQNVHDALPPDRRIAAVRDDRRTIPTTKQRVAFADVVALTTEDDQATRRLLIDAGFSYHRVTSLDDARSMLAVNRDICAVLIERTILAGLSATDQESLIAEVAGYSTFAVLKIDASTAVLSNPQIVDVIRHSHCSTRDPDMLRVIVRTGSGLQERDLSHLSLASERLSIGTTGALFKPGDITDPQLELLASALHGYAAARQFSGRFELSSIRTTFLPGGVSLAKVAVARINDARIPVVPKVDNTNAIKDEARRFVRYILPTNPDLLPEVYFHGPDGVILFGIIAQSEVADTAVPAPTLRDALRDARFEELKGNDVESICTDLVSAFTQAASRLAAINQTDVPDNPDPSYANPYLKTVKQREVEGFTWGFSNEHRAAREAAEATFTLNAESAVCHGDSHSRNVLVRRDQGFLIDYALSGPGHPATDLARLELSIFFTAFHPFGRSDDWVELQYALSYTAATAEELIAGHPDLFHADFNTVALRMCVVARDTCLNVLTRRGLDVTHYRAAKLLLAWQCLVSPDFQQSFVRAAIIALSR
jgi:Phosphotransferase enzyme family